MLPLVLGFLLGSSAWMAAVGWYVQLVHYPSFRFVPAERFGEFHAMHTSMTGVVVGLPMLVQMACALGCLAFVPRLPWWWVGLALAALAMSAGWTLAVSGPMHSVVRLEGPDGPAIGRLIASCWVRNTGWTLQAALALYALSALLPSTGE